MLRRPEHSKIEVVAPEEEEDRTVMHLLFHFVPTASRWPNTMAKICHSTAQTTITEQRGATVSLFIQHKGNAPN
jgi:hypothetical protein